MKTMYAVISGLLIETNQLFLAVCCEPMKGMTDNSLGISEVPAQQNLFFP